MGGSSEHPELWAYLASLNGGDTLSGTVAGIERFGVFVALDDGPAHPVFPGVGFIASPELAWQRFDDASAVVRVGQRVLCRFLQFDTWNLEARLSLRAMWPDPFQEFAGRVAVGQELRGEVTGLVPFGVFVRVADGVEGLVHRRGLTVEGAEPAPDVVRVGEEITVVVTGVDRVRRTLSLGFLPGAWPSVTAGKAR